MNILYPSGADMWKRLSNDKKRVEWTLEKHPQTRGCDATLEFVVDLVFYGINILKDRLTFERFRKLPRQETLARRRREIQALRPELRASRRVQIKRERRKLAYQHSYSDSLRLTDYMGGEAAYGGT